MTFPTGEETDNRTKVIDMDTSATHRPRPELPIQHPATMAEWLRTNIGTGHLSGMFSRGNEVVHTPRIGEDGYVPLSDNDTDEDGPAQVRVADPDYIAARIQFDQPCPALYAVSVRGMSRVDSSAAAVRVSDRLSAAIGRRGAGGVDYAATITTSRWMP